VRDGSSPKAVRKSPSTLRARRDSQDSDATRSEATRFHEFASSEEEADDWIQESTCYSRPLTVDDTLSIELKLRKIGREVEEEEAEEDEEGEEVDEGAIDDEDSDEDDEEDEDEDDVLKQSVVSSGFDSDDGFQTDDEQGFAHSDDESEGSEYDWWAPRRTTGEQVEHIRPKPRRSDSESSTESFKGAEVFPGLQPGKRIRYKGSRPLDVQQPPELPDSTDFVCGTLDEDKPLEQAYMSALELRRAGKHKAVPQDIDPTFPTSDPELDDDDDEVDEVSEHDSIMDSDHPIFLHGHMEPHVDDERRPRGLIPKKRSPLHSPKRLRSPPPAKRISIHRSPPPMNRRAHSPRRIRSPAPFAFGRGRLSSSVPRNDRFKTRNRFHLPDEAVAEDTENTPRFLPERRAIDIVKGLEKKRERRHEKLLERHCRKGGKAKEKKHQPGKGAERMREMGLELNAYRGRKPVAPQGSEEVHMLSY
jgi:hypothetical protein